MSFSFRHYQPKAVNAVFARWQAGDRGTLCWMATGCGKTAIAAMTARRAIHGGGRVLFVAHREDLLDGAYEAFKREDPSLSILFEQNVERVTTDDVTTGRPDAVMASIASLHRRLEKYPADFFTHIIVDESHRAAAQSYLKVIHHFPEAKLLYLTATPSRSDKKALSGYTYDDAPDKRKGDLVATCCQTIAYSMNLGEAIADGWLVEPITRIITVDVDWSTLKLKGGDYDRDQLDKIMREDGPLHKVANGLAEQVQGKCGVVFMPGVDSAHGLANMLSQSYGIDAVALDGKTEKHLRRGIVRDVKEGVTQCFVNCNIATEGFDSPLWEYMADCQPTKHAGRKIQKIGRCVRPISGDLFEGIGGEEHREARLQAIAASSKPRSLLLDFVGNMGNLPRVSSRDVLLGELPHKDYGGQPKPTDADVKHVMARRPDLSIAEARQRASDEKYLHQLIMAPRYRAQVKAEVKVKEFEDFFSIPFVWTAKEEKTYTTPDPGKEATPKQKNYIRFLYKSAGRKQPSPEWFDSLTRKQAGMVIGQLQKKEAVKT